MSNTMQWQAVYNDGDILYQYNEDGKENSYADIDRTRLSEFRLHKESGELVFSAVLDEGQRLIFRRRVRKSLDGSNDGQVYIVGWQQTICGKNIQSICYISEDGEVTVMAGRFREDHPIFYSVELLPEEM